MFPHVLFTGHVTLTSLCNVCMNGGWSSKTRTQYPLSLKILHYRFAVTHDLVWVPTVTLLDWLWASYFALLLTMFISKCLPYRAW